MLTNWHMPDAWLFAPGLDQQATGLQLAVRLLRPLVLLAAMAAFRCWYCMGTVHRQLHHQALPPAAHTARRYAAVGFLYCLLCESPPHPPKCVCACVCRLHAQLGWKALAKRLLILHGSKAVAVLAFASAMQHAGAVGWLLTGKWAVDCLLGCTGVSREPMHHTCTCWHANI